MAERLPKPPQKFGIPPVLKTLRRGTRLWRVYFQGGGHPTQWDACRNFGPTNGRFDHHTHPKRVQSRGIIYATSGKQAILTAVAEVFQDTRHIDRFRAQPWLASFELDGPLQLLNTGANWPGQAGGNMAINSGLRSRAREWSRRIYGQYPAVEGIWYPSCLTNQPCAALYERATHALPSRPSLNLPLSHPSLLANLTQIATRLNYTM